MLDELHAESKDVQVSMVVTHDGLTVLVVGGVVDPDHFGAMCADLLSLCRTAAVDGGRAGTRPGGWCRTVQENWWAVTDSNCRPTG